MNEQDYNSSLGLVSCSSEKEKYPCEAERLYSKSWQFRRAKQIVSLTCRNWFILSAKNFLVHPKQIIEPYEMTLSKCDSLYVKHWSKMVREQVENILREKPELKRIVYIGGANYRKCLEGINVKIIAPMPYKTIGFQRNFLKEFKL